MLLEQLNHSSGLSEGQCAIARWLVAHRDEVADVTTKEIARQTFTSPAAVVRLAKNLGYDGFEPLRRELVAEAAYLNRNFCGVDANHPFAAGDKPLTVAAKVAALVRETAQDTLSLMEAETLERAVALIAHACAIHMTAVSYPLPYAQDFQLKMRRPGKTVEVCTLVGEPLFTEGIVAPGDCVIVISYSGTTPVTLEMARMYHRQGIPLIALTSLGDNPLRELADVTLTLTTRERPLPGPPQRGGRLRAGNGLRPRDLPGAADWRDGVRQPRLPGHHRPRRRDGHLPPQPDGAAAGRRAGAGSLPLLRAALLRGARHHRGGSRRRPRGARGPHGRLRVPLLLPHAGLLGRERGRGRAGRRRHLPEPPARGQPLGLGHRPGGPALDPQRVPGPLPQAPLRGGERLRLP